MTWAFAAMGLLVVIMAFRTVGLAGMQHRWLREDGRPDLARQYLAFLAITGVGLAVILLGSILGVLAFKVLGAVVVGFGALMPAGRAVLARRRAPGVRAGKGSRLLPGASKDRTPKAP